MELFIMTYSPDFYRHRFNKTIHTAREITSIFLERCPHIESAVDFGCGVGTWLAALREKGVEKILGIEGAWVNPRYLAIPSESFMPYDLEQPLRLDDRFDLAISLEVAEHLSPGRADSFVDDLCSAADLILFSAALPGQGGVNHINEQWPEYWASKFQSKGYVAIDFIRSKVWDAKDIQQWYKQNVLVFANSSMRSKYNDLFEAQTNTPLSIVHPDLYLRDLKKLKKTQNIRGIASLGIEWLKKSLRGKHRR